MRRAQEAYDSCTSTMGSIRTASKQLLSLVETNSLQANNTRQCLQKARLMEPFSAKLGAVLFETNRSNLSCSHIRQVLQEAAPVFMDLLKSEQELVQLVIDETKRKKKKRKSLE